MKSTPLCLLLFSSSLLQLSLILIIIEMLPNPSIHMLESQLFNLLNLMITFHNQLVYHSYLLYYEYQLANQFLLCQSSIHSTMAKP